MKKFAVPVAYFIMDDDYVGLEVILVNAEDELDAIEKCRSILVLRELNQQEPGEDPECIPQIWVEDQKGEEEGYIIGKNPVQLIQI